MRKGIAARVIIGIAIGGSLFFAFISMQTSGGPESGNLQAPTSALPGRAQAERTILLSALESFPALERPPVRFNHDRHTAALKTEGCARCHPANEQGVLTFGYPASAPGRLAGGALRNLLHDECIGCHLQTRAANRTAGPDACGECHVARPELHRIEFAPKLPEHYKVLRDTYHKECLACHREQASPAVAETLDWKGFSLKEREAEKSAWPKVVFDYFLHDKHDRQLEKKCELCHSMSPERRAKLASEGRQPSNRDWLQDYDPGKSLSEKTAAHALCINCHVTRTKRGMKGGPVECGSCHGGRERTIRDMSGIARHPCDQKERILIGLKQDARARAVAFNHKRHEQSSRSCQDCHHRTLRACGDCHTAQGGTQEGGGIALAEAYHRVSSRYSCIGCHDAEKQKPECSGCHERMARGLVQSSCTTCHSGTLESLEVVAKLPSPRELIAQEAKDEIPIAVLEKEYKASKMPHFAIAARLTEISNQSALASYFHRDRKTICAGCHHRAPIEAGSRPPPCATCHTGGRETTAPAPTLLGAYHQQCLGCHIQMAAAEKKLPRKCTGCHEEKPGKTVISFSSQPAIPGP